jgi:hypothetical protein
MNIYALARHAHACKCGNDVVILDLRADQYLSFSVSELAELPFSIHGLTVGNPAAISRNHSSLSLEKTLFQRGLLAPQSDVDARSRPNLIEAVSAELPQSSSLDEFPVRARFSSNSEHFWAFMTAWRLSVSRVKRLPIQVIVEQIAREHTASTVAVPIDAEALGTLLAFFNGYRVLTYTSAKRCLFDTYVLIQFLRHFKVRARWVFGVQTSPFAAHCWAQLNRTVLNDRMLRVAAYTPIMVA